MLVLIGFGAWGYRTANRLDRLHVRYDLSWQALDSALARRAVVARAVATNAFSGATDADGKQLVGAGRRGRTRPPARLARRARTSCLPRWRWSIRGRCRRA